MYNKVNKKNNYMNTQIFIQGDPYMVNKFSAVFTEYMEKKENEKGILLTYRICTDAKNDMKAAYSSLLKDNEIEDIIYWEGNSIYLETSKASIF